MTLFKEDQLANYVVSFIHRDTQQQKHKIDLTIDEVHTFIGPGSLDFGGSEFEPANRQLISPQKKDQSDDYGWWMLPKGSYRLRMNEKIKPGNSNSIIGILVPHEHAQLAGIISDSRLLAVGKEQQPLALNIHVPEPGCNIKENARVASLYIVEEY